jgi:hypothetical protein
MNSIAHLHCLDFQEGCNPAYFKQVQDRKSLHAILYTNQGRQVCLGEKTLLHIMHHLTRLVHFDDEGKAVSAFSVVVGQFLWCKPTKVLALDSVMMSSQATTKDCYAVARRS